MNRSLLTGFLDLDDGTSVHICTQRGVKKTKDVISSSVACTRTELRPGTDLLNVLENLERKRGGKAGQYKQPAATGPVSRV